MAQWWRPFDLQSWRLQFRFQNQHKGSFPTSTCNRRSEGEETGRCPPAPLLTWNLAALKLTSSSVVPPHSLIRLGGQSSLCTLFWVTVESWNLDIVPSYVLRQNNTYFWIDLNCVFAWGWMRRMGSFWFYGWEKSHALLHNFLENYITFFMVFLCVFCFKIFSFQNRPPTAAESKRSPLKSLLALTIASVLYLGRSVELNWKESWLHWKKKAWLFGDP